MRGEKMSEVGRQRDPRAGSLAAADPVPPARARSCAWPCSGAHYRQPLDFTDEAVLRGQAASSTTSTVRSTAPAWKARRSPGKGSPIPRFVEALDDDLNTPKALATSCASSRARSAPRPATSAARPPLRLRASGRPARPPRSRTRKAWLQGELAGSAASAEADQDDAAGIEALVNERRDARKATRLRPRRPHPRRARPPRGILLEDGPDGTTWRRA